MKFISLYTIFVLLNTLEDKIDFSLNVIKRDRQTDKLLFEKKELSEKLPVKVVEYIDDLSGRCV